MMWKPGYPFNIQNTSMCGIAGIVDRQPRGFSAESIRPALQCLQHRGPEQEATWINQDSSVVFGHRRLCIIDLSAAASQPMHYMGRFTLIHNGEIYNYRELKQELEK